MNKSNDGISFYEYMQQGKPKLSEFIEGAIAVTALLDLLHRKHILGQISPYHLIVRQDSSGISIADAVAEVDRDERLLPYMSPELASRTNQQVDHRSDMYSLGVILYEWITDQLPWQADDQEGWFHAHLAIQPKSADEVPTIIEWILNKLLSKDPVERYQSSVGLIHDLQLCRSYVVDDNIIPTFPLGDKDRSERLFVSDYVYGREQQLTSMDDALVKVIQGASGAIWLSGPAGIGKSALISHFLKQHVIQREVLLASSSMDASDKGVTIHTLLEAIVQPLREMNARYSLDREAWRNKLVTALGSNSSLIADAIPELKALLGPLPHTEMLPREQSRNRFQFAIRRLIQVLSIEYPIVLFLDDLHRADDELIQLLSFIISDPSLNRVLLICAWRSGIGGQEHIPLPESDNRSFIQLPIELGALEFADYNILLSDSLGTDPDKTVSLTQDIMQQSAGNLLYFHQFLYYCHELDLVRFNQDLREWEWDSYGIRNVHTPDELSEFMIAKLSILPDATKQIIARAACIGHHFSILDLSLLCSCTVQELSYHLWMARTEGLIIDTESERNKKSIVFRFVHDQVYTAAYALLPEECGSIHLQVGRILESRLEQGERELMFEIADHYNAGIAWINDDSERLRSIELNLEAGRMAQSLSNFATALRYYEIGFSSIRHHDWESHFSLCFEIGLGVLACKYRIGEVEEEQLYTLLMNYARNRSERTRLIIIKLSQLLQAGKHLDVITLGLVTLRAYNIRMPAKPSLLRMAKELLWTTRLVRKNLHRLHQLQEAKDPSWTEAMELILIVGPAAYFHENTKELSLLLTCIPVRISIEHGTTPSVAYIYASFATILGQVRHEFDLAHELGLISAHMAEQKGTPSIIAQTFMVVGSGPSIWGASGELSYHYLRRGWELAKESGNPIFAGYNIVSYINILSIQGRIDELLEIDDLLDELEELGYPQSLRMIPYLDKQFASNMKGLTVSDFSLSNEWLDLERYIDRTGVEEANPLFLSYYHITKLKMCYLHGHYAEAIRMADIVERLSNYMTSFISEMDVRFYTSLAIAAGWDGIALQSRGRWRKHFKKHLAFFRRLAAASESFTSRYLLLEAEFSRMNNKHDTQEKFVQVITSTEAEGHSGVKAIVFERCAMYCLEEEKRDAAQRYMQEAVRFYRQWGADRKVRQLGESYPRWFTESVLEGAAREVGEGESEATHDNRVSEPVVPEFAAIVKAARSLGGGLALTDIIDQIMTVIMQLSGAERACLLTVSPDTIVAECLFDSNGQREMAISAKDRSEHANAWYSEAIVWEVASKDEPIILEDAWRKGKFIFDRYVSARRCRSIVGLPISGGQVVLYLENNYSPSVFLEAPLETLRVLATQAYHTKMWFKQPAEEKDNKHDMESASVRPIDSSLTERELEILGLIAVGLSNPEIAEQIGLTLNTVKVHSRNIFSKLGVNNRVKAAAKAQEWNLF